MPEKYCRLCWSKENLQEHHTSYSPEETVTLCAKCHGRVHADPLHPLNPTRIARLKINGDSLTILRKYARDGENSLEDTLERVLQVFDEMVSESETSRTKIMESSSKSGTSLKSRIREFLEGRKKPATSKVIKKKLEISTSTKKIGQLCRRMKDVKRNRASGRATWLLKKNDEN